MLISKIIFYCLWYFPPPQSKRVFFLIFWYVTWFIKKEWKYLGTHISVVQILSFLEVPFVLRFAIVLRCQQFLHNDRFYEACYIGLSIEQCKKWMLVHDWNRKVLLIDQIYLAQMWWIEMLIKNKNSFYFKQKSLSSFFLSYIDIQI